MSIFITADRLPSSNRKRVLPIDKSGLIMVRNCVSTSLKLRRNIFTRRNCDSGKNIHDIIKLWVELCEIQHFFKCDLLQLWFESSLLKRKKYFSKRNLIGKMCFKLICYKICLNNQLNIL